MARSNIRYWGHIDRDPGGTKRKVLVTLASARLSMTRREIQGHVFGDKYGATQTIYALRWLEECHLVSRVPSNSRRWRITDAGRLTLDWIAVTEQSA